MDGKILIIYHRAQGGWSEKSGAEGGPGTIYTKNRSANYTILFLDNSGLTNQNEKGIRTLKKLKSKIILRLTDYLII